MHSLIMSLHLSDSILDIGGGKTSSYNCLLSSRPVTVNISKSNEPDCIIESPVDPYPISSSTFTDCIVFNVLEHVYDWDHILSESSRLLKPHGRIHIIVPFLYQVHPCPSDFLRPTSEYLVNKLSDYKYYDVDVIPYNIGPFTLAFSNFPVPKVPFISPLTIYVLLMLDFIYSILFPLKSVAYQARFPLFYYATAKASDPAS